MATYSTKTYKFLVNFSKETEHLPYQIMQGSTDTTLHIHPYVDGELLFLGSGVTATARATNVYEVNGETVLFQRELEIDTVNNIIVFNLDSEATQVKGANIVIIDLLLNVTGTDPGTSYSSNITYNLLENKSLGDGTVLGNVPTIRDILDSIEDLEENKADKDLTNVQNQIFYDKMLEAGYIVGTPEAPINNTLYGRKNGTWVDLAQEQYITWENVDNKPENFVNTINGEDGDITLVASDVGATEEAPNDGKAYIRVDEEWSPVGEEIPINLVSISQSNHGFTTGNFVGYDGTLFEKTRIDEASVIADTYILPTGVVKVINSDVFELYTGGTIYSDQVGIVDEDGSMLERGRYYISKKAPGTITKTYPDQYNGDVIQAALDVTTTDDPARFSYNIVTSTTGYLGLVDEARSGMSGITQITVTQTAHGFQQGDLVGYDDNGIYELADVSSTSVYTLASGVVDPIGVNTFILYLDGVVPLYLLEDLRDSDGLQISDGRYYLDPANPGKATKIAPDPNVNIIQTAFDGIDNSGEDAIHLFTSQTAYYTGNLTSVASNDYLDIDVAHSFPIGKTTPVAYVGGVVVEADITGANEIYCEYLIQPVDQISLRLYDSGFVPQGLNDTLVDGDTYYLSQTVAGELTNVEPVSGKKQKCMRAISGSIDITVDSPEVI